MLFLKDYLKMTRQGEAIVSATDCQYVLTDNIKRMEEPQSISKIM
jgi:hypothetical protein